MALRIARLFVIFTAAVTALPTNDPDMQFYRRYPDPAAVSDETSKPFARYLVSATLGNILAARQPEPHGELGVSEGIRGIDKAIELMHQEASDLNAIEAAEKKGDQAAYAKAKANLDNTYAQAVAQRKKNQATLPANNPAQADLATYATKQQAAGQKIASLTGNYAKDKATIDALHTGFAGGLALNQAARKHASQASQSPQ